MVERSFWNNLSSKHKEFLHEHDKKKKPIKEIAEYLDRMNKHKKNVSINSLESSETAEKIAELNGQNLALHKKIDSLQDDLRMMMMEMQKYSQPDVKETA